MSYILDALKKADAERERGQGRAPGLHARPAPMVDDPAEPATRSLGVAVWVIAGLLGALVVLLGWRLWAPAEAPPPVQVSAVSPAAPAPVTPGAPPAPVIGAITPQPAPAPAPQPRSDAARPTEARAPRITESTPGGTGSQNATATPSAATGASRTEAWPATRPAAPAASRPSEAPALYTPQTLPEAVRRDLPAIAVSGAMYSETPAQRMLIINSQVFREGDQPLPELALEEIRLKSAVFRFRGHRVLIAY